MSRRLVELAAVLTMCVAAYMVGVGTVDDAIGAGRAPFFYQSEFAPAVLAACGLGYHNTRASEIPPLESFLGQREDRFDCRVLSQQPPRIRTLDSFQGISRYLELSVSLLWRVRGVSWTAIRPLFGVFFAITVVATYGLFRVAAGPILSLFASLLIAFSPLQLANLPNLRDYAKAPFVLLLLLLLGTMLRRPWRPAAMAGLCMSAGLVAGVGLGFRNDLLLLLPLVVVVAMVAPAPTRTGLAGRAARVLLFAVIFGAIAAPVIRAYGRGSNTAHVALLGAGSAFDAPLGIRAAAYDLGYLYNDSYLYTRVRALADEQGAIGSVPIGTAAYDQASGRMLTALVRAVPADFITRGVGALLGVIQAPFRVDAVDVSYWRPAFLRVLEPRIRAVRYLAWPAAILGLSLIAIGLALRFTATLAGLLLFLVLAAGAAIQFHPRHFFYLEPLVWWPSVAAVALWSRLVPLVRGVSARAWLRAGVLLLGVPVLVATVTVIARHAQEVRWRDAVARLRQAPREEIPRTMISSRPSTVRFTVPALRDGFDASMRAAHPVSAAYYAITFGGEQCDRLAIAPTFRYESTRAYDDFTETRALSLPLDGGSVTVYRSGYEGDFPVSGMALAPPTFLRARFVGVELAEDSASCVQRIARIQSREWPALLTDVVDYPDAAFHQQLAWERPSPVAAHIFSVPSTLSRRHLADALREGGIGRIGTVRFMARSIARRGNGFAANGLVREPFGYALVIERSVQANALAVVSGEVSHGGITVGLQQEGRWLTTLNVTEPGPFVVALAVPTSGNVQLIVANCLIGGGHWNAFRIDTIGWGER